MQDQTGAALIIASVTIVDANGTPHTLQVDDHGVATFTALATGTYQLQADAESFQSYDGPITLKKGANQITLTLPLAGLNEQVIVRNSTDDVRGNSFTSELTPQEIAELPDDPDELQQVLDQMAGPGATMRVNGFTGGRLPPKSQIRSIRFRMNSFDAEYHEGGGFGIDIVTKPGMDDWKGMSNFGFRDESLNARNAFAPTLAPEQYRRFGLNADGPIVKGRTSLALNFDGNNSYDSKTINATTPDGLVNGSVRTPEDRMFGSLRVDHSLSKTQQMLFEVQRNYIKRDNLGVGDFDLPSRAYTSETADTAVRFALNGTIVPKVAHELRVRFESSYATQSSASADPTVIVQGAFSTGGAGKNSNRQAKTLEVADNIDWTVAKKHAFRAGLLGEMDWYDTTDLTNFNGTFTFGGLDRYDLGLPTTYTQRLGTSAVNYTYAQLGLYVQDTWTPNKRLSLSIGLRQEFQSHLGDYANLAPRLGFTWQVSESTVRGGYGVFNDWYDASDYQQVLLVNGVNQQDEVIRFPGYPDPSGGVIATPLPPSKILPGRASRCRTTCTRRGSASSARPAGAAAAGELHDAAQHQSVPVVEHQRAHRRRVSGSALRPRHRAAVDRFDGPGPVDDQHQLREPAAAPVLRRQLPVVAHPELHGQRFLAAGRLRPGRRVGSVYARRAASVLRDGQHRDAEEHARGALRPGELGAPLQPDDRVRYQRRHRDQRPPERRNAQHAARCREYQPESPPE